MFQPESCMSPTLADISKSRYKLQAQWPKTVGITRVKFQKITLTIVEMSCLTENEARTHATQAHSLSENFAS